VNVSQYKPEKMDEAPSSGTLIGRFKIHGHGSSFHKLASSADGWPRQCLALCRGGVALVSDASEPIHNQVAD
jgi:hypothetical protein